jgi:hypothetical protein
VQIEKLESDLNLREETIATNHVAHAKQKRDLKQALLDLADFEAMKVRIIKLEACIRDNTEVQEAVRDAERRIKGLAREAEGEGAGEVLVACGARAQGLDRVGVGVAAGRARDDLLEGALDVEVCG